MKNSKLVIAGLAVALIAVFAVSAQKISIDFRYNVGRSDPAGDYFSWNKADGKAIKDTFDTASGASRLKTTEEFNVVYNDGSSVANRRAIPATFRGLFLYPVSDRETFTFDNLTVTPQGSEFLIRYVHRGTAYQILTNRKRADVTTDASYAAAVGESVAGSFVIKEAFRKAGTDGTKMSDLDWNKITLLRDAPAANSAKSATGYLTVGFANNILTLKGDLTIK
jgi:phosphopantetheinyl transferase (holo-ACP synthase)